jgi:predicted DCC family thiol-disulfide oxidoreductase YuxK
MTPAIVLFDGICNLCNASVRFIIERDPQGYFQFASLQSAQGQQILRQYGLAQAPLTSIVLIEQDRAYTHSDAALRIANHLVNPWPLLAYARWIPRPIRDALYTWVANNRYRWFGQAAQCMMPSRQTRSRFLE